MFENYYNNNFDKEEPFVTTNKLFERMNNHSSKGVLEEELDIPGYSSLLRKSLEFDNLDLNKGVEPDLIGPGPPIVTTDANVRGPKGANLFCFHLPNEMTNW